MFIKNNYKQRIQELAGVLEESNEDVIVKKIGLPKFVAKWAQELSPKYAVWIANSFKKYLLEKTAEKIPNDKMELMLKDTSEGVKSEVMSEISVVEPDYQHILDWLRGRSSGAVVETDRLDFKELTFEEALERSESWHKELEKVQGGQIEDEDGKIIKTYPDGYYWIDLEKGSCDKEGKAMGHCGRCSGAGDIFSLRKDGYPYLSGCFDKKHNIITQLRGRANTKPKSSFHPYILDFLKDPKINVNFFKYDGYRNDDNFRIEDLTETQITEILKTKPKLLTGQNFEALNLTDTDIKYLIEKFPSVVPMKTLLKYTDDEELKRNLLNPKYIKNLELNSKIIELFTMLAEIGGKKANIAALALYTNTEIRKRFLTLKSDDGERHSNTPLIDTYISLLNKTGVIGKKYIKNLTIDTDTFLNIYIKENPLKFIELLNSNNEIFGIEGVQHAQRLLQDPNFRKAFIEKSDEEALDLLVDFVNDIYENDINKNLNENFSVKNNIRKVLDF